jgi:hypothetical protein
MVDNIIVKNSKFNSIVVVVCCCLIVGLIVVGYFGWKSMNDESVRLRTEVTQFKQLTDTLVRSSTTWATKGDLEKQLEGMLTKEDLSALEKDLNKLDAKLVAVGRLVGVIDKKVSLLEASDNTIPSDNPPEVCDDGRLVDVHKYTQNIQVKELEDSNKAPVAEVKFDASKATPWQYEVFGREFRLTTVVGKQESGQMSFHHKLQYSVPDKGPQVYDVKIVASDYIQAPLKNKMFWFNPIVDLDFFVGGRVANFATGPGRPNDLVSAGVDLGLSLSSYGETKADSLFRLFRFGLGYNAERRAGQLSLAPITFNIGKPLPVLTNLYLTPMFAIDTAGGFTLNLGAGVQF